MAGHPSYFTCTLGEAALFNEKLDAQAPYTTINGFIDYLSETRWEDVAVASARPARDAKKKGGDTEWEVEALSKLESVSILPLTGKLYLYAIEEILEGL